MATIDIVAPDRDHSSTLNCRDRVDGCKGLIKENICQNAFLLKHAQTCGWMEDINKLLRMILLLLKDNNCSCKCINQHFRPSFNQFPFSRWSIVTLPFLLFWGPKTWATVLGLEDQ
jgi:hypothetical protein